MMVVIIGALTGLRSPVFLPSPPQSRGRGEP
jgi:hypothetical protein